ncbi:MAG: 50S ribosomal protein L13 [Lentisphaerae bacterium]|nr:50S ribosomal protein L13 [Lentisphaerota bacterium]
MTTTVPRTENIQRAWHLVDASGQALGRLAVKIADRLRGKHKPTYTPHVDTGDFVVVINAQLVKLTGKKNDQKLYISYSGYRGGRKEIKAAIVRERAPERMIYDAVKRMLPRNRLMRVAFKRLKVYAGDKHPHAGQNPAPWLEKEK